MHFGVTANNEGQNHISSDDVLTQIVDITATPHSLYPKVEHFCIYAINPKWQEQ